MWGLYAHAPWCARRCPYCAFATTAHQDPPWVAWAEHLVVEHDRHAPLFQGPASTVYLGGGSPSRAPAEVLAWLLQRLPRAPGAEVTVEVNPEDAEPAWLEAVVAAGVDRISLGVQSLHPRHSRLLGRRAGPEACRRAVGRVAALGLRSWTADLMFALPGQSVAAALEDARALLDLGPPHVSLYGLTWEPDTPFARGRAKGVLHPVDEEDWRAMYDGIVELLEGAGLHRYEVSNAALSGHESAHNRLYWTDAPYMGLGPSAHGYAPDGRRWVNHRDAAAWLDAPDPVATWETPSLEQRALDTLISTLRGREGVDLGRLERRTGHRVDPAVLPPMVEHGLVVLDGQWLRLGPAGWPLADAVTSHLAEHLVR